MDTAHLLKQFDIKPSYTRMMIYDYLKNHMNHPTVDEIYQDLIQNLPTLSKTTVYNTLKLLMDKRLVNELVMEQQKHYDLATSPHAHFQCTLCETIYDIDMTLPIMQQPKEAGFIVEDAQLIYKGKCAHCNQIHQA
jgi:Fe2+ or Zn2+ uptake regulation protein